MREPRKACKDGRSAEPGRARPRRLGSGGHLSRNFFENRTHRHFISEGATTGPEPVKVQKPIVFVSPVSGRISSRLAAGERHWGSCGS